MKKSTSRVKNFRSVVTVGTMMSTPAACGNDVPDISSNPPSFPCPESIPAEAEDCVGGEGLICEYTGCSEATPYQAECNNQGLWVVSEYTCNPPPPVICPEDQPEPKTACESEGLECQYGDCYGSPSFTATCQENLVWRVSEIACNPPPPVICPEDRPEPETACESEGLECQYGDCDGSPSFTATCLEDYTWEVTETPCNND